MNIIQKVNNREITPRHNNYQEVTVDAKGNGPVINFDGVHARTGGLAGLSPLKDRNHPFKRKKPRKTRKQRLEEKKLQEEFNNLEVPTPPIIPSDTTTTDVSPIKQTWLDNTQKALGAAGWVPGWGALADLGNAAISGGRSLYSLAKGDTEGAKKHGKNVLWNIAYAVPGLEYGAKGVKGGTKLYKNLRTTGNPIQSFRKNPIRSSVEAGLGGLVESETSYEPGSGYNPSMFDMQDVKRAKEALQKEFGEQKINFNENIKKPIQDHIKKVESYSNDDNNVSKNDDNNVSKQESKGDKPNRSWQASDYQKYYDNMKKQKK